VKSIIAAMLLWIGANTGYNVDIPHPTVVKLEQDALEYTYTRGQGLNKGVELHGFYDAKSNTIYLPKTFDEYNAWHKGILLHELVHYVQDMNEVRVNCNAELEKDAWPLQRKYLLEMHGVEWNYDGLWFKLISNCQTN
jgi:hypothetical protein